jgi:hypothetical protein
MVREITLDTNESEKSTAMISYKQGNDLSWSHTKTRGLPAKQRVSRLKVTERIS